MHKIFTIIKREYKEAVLKKSFLVMTMLMPVLMIAMAVVPSLLAQMDVEEPSVIQIYDESGIVSANIDSLFNDTFADGSPRFITNLLNSVISRDLIIQSAKDNLLNGKIDGLLVIPSGLVNGEDLLYYSKNVANFDINNRLRNTISNLTTDYRLKNAGFDNEVINKLTKGLHLKTIKITKEGAESERGFLTEFFSTFIFVFFLYMTLIMYGFVLMRSVIEEKTSRIIEVLLSSVSPFQLMTGKIIGAGSVGLTQYVIWAVFGTILVLAGPSMLSVPPGTLNFSPVILFYFVLFYLLGFFLYATLYTCIGAVTNTDQEAQQMSMPVTLLLVVPIIMISFMIQNPESMVVNVMSYIPFFAPMIMFARINLAAPATSEIWLSVGILLATIFLMIWISSKIFRVGILMYGKRPTLPEIARWFKG
jgi:ABC-2 type transport system permease protein